MHILIYGAGAIGSLLGAFLRKGGHRVVLLGREKHLSEIQKKGLEVRGLWGCFTVGGFQTRHSVEEIIDEKPFFDLILLTVKAFDTASNVPFVKKLMKPQTFLISFQNGLNNAEAILEAVPLKQFLAGRIITGVDLVPGSIEVTVSADNLVMGPFRDVQTVWPRGRAQKLFQDAGLGAREVDNILTHVWLKVIYNCCLNGLCSVLDIPYGKILDHPAGPQSLRNISRECYAVAGKKGVSLEPGTPEGYYNLLVNTLIPKTAGHFPSMLKDIEEGRRTEIDALNGAIVRLGQTFRIPTPENEKVVQLIEKKIKKARRRLDSYDESEKT